MFFDQESDKMHLYDELKSKTDYVVLIQKTVVRQSVIMKCEVGQNIHTQLQKCSCVFWQNEQMCVIECAHECRWITGSWTMCSRTTCSWTTCSWTMCSWTMCSWTTCSWTTCSWTTCSWTMCSWTTCSWTTCSWTTCSWRNCSRTKDCLLKPIDRCPFRPFSLVVKNWNHASKPRNQI
jgi:hypothetical protein